MSDLAIRLIQPLNLLLLPVLALQGRQVQRDTPRLPEAAITEGTAPGTSPGPGREPVRLLVLGDSMAAGVGVDHNDNALAGTTARALADRTGSPVVWRVAARTGATAGYTADKLAGRAEGSHDSDGPDGHDAVVVSVGVNDVLRFRSLRAWDQDIRRLAAVIRQTNGDRATILFSGLPPLGLFPALPDPLRTALALRGRLLDHALAALAPELGTVHTPMPLDAMAAEPAAFFARDGFHPSAHGYQALAEAFAPVIAGRISPP
jgi:lysophospholipase L1-like esterase